MKVRLKKKEKVKNKKKRKSEKTKCKSRWKIIDFIIELIDIIFEIFD